MIVFDTGRCLKKGRFSRHRGTPSAYESHRSTSVQLLSGVWSGGSLSKHPCHRPPCVYENGVTATSRALRTSCYLLSFLYGIHVPKRLFLFPHCLLHAASA